MCCCSAFYAQCIHHRKHMTGKCMCMCAIVWHKSSLTASNSLSCGSCCGAEAWWPIPPAPYFSFNDAQINSSTLFQNSSSPRPSSSRHPHLCSCLPCTQVINWAHLPLLHFLWTFVMFFLRCPCLPAPTWLHTCTVHLQQLNFTFVPSPIKQILVLLFVCEGVWHACTFVLTFWKAHLLLSL